MIWYETTYRKTVTKRKGPDKGNAVIERRRYVTKSLTPMHEHIRDNHPGARTVKYDDKIEWAFGLWCEVIARSEPIKKEKAIG